MQTVMKLALQFGYVKPSELLDKLNSWDIGLWQAYDGLYPFGQQHTDHLLAELISVCFNMWKSKDSPILTVEDILGHEPLTEEYVTATLKAFTNGTD
jgi:hypothetical protein